jgi:hypothetical protein
VRECVGYLFVILREPPSRRLLGTGHCCGDRRI